MMDDLDANLLGLLRKNARESFVNLASELQTSEGTVRARLKRLTDDGTIRRFTIRTAGANIKACIEVSVETNVEMGQYTDQISQWPGVEVVYEVSGDQDLMIIAEATDTEDLNATIDRIRGLPNIRSTRSRLILKEM